MNSMFSDEEGHSTDGDPMGQHDDNDPLPQILQDFLSTNIPDHTTSTGGNYTGPDSIPTPPTEGERFLHEQSQVPIYDGSPTCMLKALVLILQFQVNFNISNVAISSMMSMIFDFFLPKHLNPVLPKSHAELRRFMRAVGLGFNLLTFIVALKIVFFTTVNTRCEIIALYAKKAVIDKTQKVFKCLEK